MGLVVNDVPRESDRNIFEVLGGILVEAGEKAGEIIKAKEIAKQAEEARRQLFVLALVLGSLFILTRA